MATPTSTQHQPSFGIDFGTTNSSVARAVNGKVDLVTFPNGSQSSRSLLYLEKAGSRIQSYSGSAAIDRYLAAHAEQEQLGRLVQSLKSYLPVRNLTATEVFGRRYTLEDLVSRILRDLRQRAEEVFGQPIRNVTVGRPVRFVGAETADDDAYALTRLTAAFTQAGFDSVTYVLEPVAAALAYRATLDHDETILIGDFGGGTSDFSLLRIGPQVTEVIASAGLPLAGDAFDARIIRHLVSPALGSNSQARGLNKMLPAVPAWIYANLERWHYLSFLRSRNVLEILATAQRRALEPDRIQALRTLIDEDLGYPLHQAVQRTKFALSRADSAVFTFGGEQLGRTHSTIEIGPIPVTRSDFESWLSPELTAIAETVDRLLAGAGMPMAGIDRVFLTGGTSFVPSVRRIFESRFSSARVVTGAEFTSIAQGLALHAARA